MCARVYIQGFVLELGLWDCRGWMSRSSIRRLEVREAGTLFKGAGGSDSEKA